MLLVIYNPVSGPSSGAQITQGRVLPLLASHGRTPDLVAATEHAGHAGQIAVDFISKADSTDERITIVLVSGDGTLHEVVEALYAHYATKPSKPKIGFVLVPGGTANALHSSLFNGTQDADPTLASLRAYLAPSPTTTPLRLTDTRVLPAPAEPIISAVVTSTALHAAILHDSEALRVSTPGLERFKLAAAQNQARWYDARVQLLGAEAQIYDPRAGNFVKYEGETALKGPFVYFLAVVNVDRLEPAFRVAPLRRSHPASGGNMDLVVVRPRRDASLPVDEEEAKKTFGEKIWAVLGKAYEDGAHPSLRYAADGTPSVEAEGENVVEYFRVGGWEWIPDEADNKAHLLCTDGTIHEIPQGGKAKCAVADAWDLVVYA